MVRRCSSMFVAMLMLASILVERANGKLAMEIVYDASGSMWARIGETERFLVLNKALLAFLDQIPPDVMLSLRVYGARQKSDCDDSVLVVPFGTDNRDEIRKAVAKIKPLGKTPIQKSLLLAAEDLKSQEGTRVIVLVSDGAETCQGDPCDTARKLAENEKIQIDVVGFAISNEETRRQLTCIATVGAGNYFEAANAQDLANGLGTIGAVAPPPEPQKGRINVRIERPRGVQAPTRGMKIDIFELNKPESPVVSFEGQNPVSAELPVGGYRVVARIGDAEGLVDNLNLEPNGLQKVTIEFPPLEGVLLVTAKSGVGVLGTRVLCSVFPAGQHEVPAVAEQYSSLAMPLAEGNYDVRCNLLGASVPTEVWQNNIAITPGTQRELDVVFNFGSLTVSALGPPEVMGDSQTYAVYPAGDHVNKLAWAYAGTPVELPAGTYDVEVEVGTGPGRRVQWIEGIKVKQLSPAEATADFRPGQILLQATTGGNTVGNDAKFTIFPPGEPRREAVGWAFSGVPLQVPAGTYDALVEYQLAPGQVQKQWVMGLAVGANQQLERQVEFATGQIQVHVFAGGEDVAGEGGYSVYLPGEQDKPIAKFENHSVQNLPTGSYDVKGESYHHQYGEFRKDVVITKDKLTELKLDFATGKLVMHVMQGGEDLGTGATYYVYPQNEKYNHIAFAFSGTGMDLVPGVYDVKVTLGPTVKWKKGVFVDSSETTDEKIEF